LAAAVTAWEERGGRVLLVTYTIRHKSEDDLTANVDGLLRARRSARSGGWAQRFSKRFGLVGSIRALEVTHGANGWHPHLHEMLFVSGDVDAAAVQTELEDRWQSMVGLAGLRDVNEHGCRVQLAQMSVADYVAKFGRERVWGPEHELAKAVVKGGRMGSRTPVDLLRAYGAGDGRAGFLWQQYAAAFKGKRQLAWSRGLRELLVLEPELTDEELAQEQTARGTVLTFLNWRQWQYVLGNDVRGELLDVAATGDVRQVIRFLVDLGCPEAGLGEFPDAVGPPMAVT
jgi:hypothetical protein